MDFISQLQSLLPLAIKWAEDHSDRIKEEGISLTKEQIELAKEMGVTSPEKIKILHVDKLPLPEHEQLNQAATQIGFLRDEMPGLTLGHSIYLRKDSFTRQFLSRELRHVYQYEVFGSIPGFLVEYLKQIVLVGYENSLLVQDAKQHEVKDE